MTTPHAQAKRTSLRACIRLEAVDLLQQCPEGLTYTALMRAMHQRHPARNLKTPSNDIVNLDRYFPSSIHRAVRGHYRHNCFKDGAGDQVAESRPRALERAGRIPEEKFYPLFAAWLTDDAEEVTVAIPLGGNAFRDRWGTPDVLGKNESRRSDVIKGPTSIVSAEVKVDTASLLIGFGQACAHMLFSHKSYLVVPADAAAEELDRLVALCQMFGLGLVIFDASSLVKPGFRLLVRPVKHEPDLHYTNKYIKRVESKLFS